MIIFSVFSNDKENDLEFTTKLYDNYGTIMWKMWRSMKLKVKFLMILTIKT